MTRSLIWPLVLVAVLAITAKTCAEKERQILVKQAAAPRKEQPPARHPAPPYQWVLDEHGLGPVRFGATREDAEAATGEPFRVGPNGRAPCGVADWPGAPKGVSVVMGSNVVRRIEVDAYGEGLATVGGVKIGTDSEYAVTVFNALGKPVQRGNGSGIVVNLTPTVTPAVALAVSFLDHKVWSFKLGYIYEVDNHNVCV